MEVFYWDGVDQPAQACRQAVLSVGNFDGVHKGHAALLRRLVRLRDRLSHPAVVATFDPPPLTLLRPDLRYDYLTTLPQRLEFFERMQVDTSLIFRTTPDLLKLSAKRFWNELLCDHLQVKGLVEGANFCFGREREGNVSKLRLWCDEQGIPLEIVHDVYRRGIRISSSQVRTLISRGEVAQAKVALGRYYSITGKVVRGDGRGRTLGFPTANLVDIPTMIPAAGVYAAIVAIEGGQFSAAINIGSNPTFGIEQLKVEAHVLDYQGDLYDQMLAVHLVSRIRNTKPFPSVHALKEQLKMDCERARIETRSQLESVRGKRCAV